jgi:riboflavin synthase
MCDKNKNLCYSVGVCVFMFTGIITDIGTITNIIFNPDMVITVKTQYNHATINIGASVACNGMCLTVIHKTDNELQFCLSNETRNKTTAKNWLIGQALNLERALKIGDELGGHFVTGHVDGIGHIMAITLDEGSWDIRISAPTAIMPFIAPKGSICCDGISLTVNQVDDNGFHVNIIPHTQHVTNWQSLKIGDMINLEIDMMARYMARYMDYKQK